MMTSIGDLGMALLLRRNSVRIETDLMRLTEEMATGRVADVTRHLNGNLSALAAIDASRARLAAFAGPVAQATLFTRIQQESLGLIDQTATDLSSGLILATDTGDPTQIQGLATDAAQDFAAALGALNARAGETVVFSGTAAGTAAVLPADQILAALDAVVAGATTGAEVMARVTDWFADPANWYAGGDPRGPMDVGPQAEVTLDVTAADPALRDTLAAMAAVAMIDRGALAGDPQAQSELARAAGETLLAGQSARVDLAARLGTVEARIAEAGTRNEAEIAALDMARNNLVLADPYETAVALEEAQLRLETLYALTARLSGLSLAEYLR
ncbi:MAG: flagellar biosynthesis protein FlgL [Rhodobacterales bacterium]|nr:flagellar biosynthesis protein FlgL [Rhodobacterales bacterium]